MCSLQQKKGTAVFLWLCVVNAEIAEGTVKPTLVKYQRFTKEKNILQGKVQNLCICFIDRMVPVSLAILCPGWIDGGKKNEHRVYNVFITSFDTKTRGK